MGRPSTSQSRARSPASRRAVIGTQRVSQVTKQLEQHIGSADPCPRAAGKEVLRLGRTRLAGRLTGHAECRTFASAESSEQDMPMPTANPGHVSLTRLGATTDASPRLLPQTCSRRFAIVPSAWPAAVSGRLHVTRRTRPDVPRAVRNTSITLRIVFAATLPVLT